MAFGLINLAVMFVAFGLLARIAPCNPGQPRFLSGDLADNALYWLLGVLLYGGLTEAMIRGGAGLVFQGQGAAVSAAVLGGYGWVATWPLWAQALGVIVAMDFVQYWLHRLFHTRTLWSFHAIHHSAEDLDWTTTFRIHPVNFVVYGAGALALVRLAGFSPAVLVLIAPFNLVVGALVHANVNWTFGPLRYVIVSPVYHRWHHAKDPAAHDKNFAPTFPIFDLMFGTFYMPKGVLPADYGVEGAPKHFLAQMVWPFGEVVRRFLPARKRAADPAAA
ncbi:MAG TPA: sterol desaturase family protein [Caulobacteraceae bacterium]|nr:sterol desaturase family protein [Caulobacteraceae bacterium]